MSDPSDNGGGARRKPGPQTPEGKARISVAATRHGAWRLLLKGQLPTAASCALRSRCDCPVESRDPCPVFARAHAEYYRAVATLPHLAGKPHLAPLIREYAKNLTALDLIDTWTARVGAVRLAGNSLERHGIWKVRWTIAESARRLAEALAITPRAAAELGLDGLKDVNPAEALAARLARVPPAAQEPKA